MICEKCGKEFFKDYRTDGWSVRNTKPRFCSISCARSRIHSSESNAQRSRKVKQAHKDGRCKAGNLRKFTKEDRAKGSAIQKENRSRYYQELLEKGLFEKLPKLVRRKLLLEESNYTCQSCKNKEWLGEKIWLEIHHIDDDNSNNKKDNLMVVCLNCHAVLDSNYRNRGR